MFVLPPDPDDEAVMERMKMLMDKVKEMREQRQAFQNQFWEKVMKDDITTALVTCNQDDQEVPFFTAKDWKDEYFSLFIGFFSKAVEET
jgi:DNA-directed RNA polymerase sigma subunit (sigma70/sigma32)